MPIFKPPAATAAAGTVLLWASAFPAISVAVRGLGPVGLSVARLTVASVTLALACPFMKVHRPRARDLPLIALCGLAGMTAYQLLLNTGERVVPAGTASLLVATAPVYASLLAACFLGERPTSRRWAGSAIALAGTALIAAAHGLGFGAAALAVLAAAIVQAVFHTAQKPLLSYYSGFEVTLYAMWAGTIFILPWTGSLLRALPHASASAIGSAVFLGVAPSAAGFVLWAYAMARMDVGRVTVGLYLVPAAAIIISLVWLSQIPGPAELAGGAVALAGVILASTRSRNPGRTETSRRDNPWSGRPAGAIVWTVGRWSKITERTGVALPAGEGRTATNAIDGLLELSRSQESRARQLACRNLCTCHVRADDDRVWTRLLELAEDPDPRVRGDVIHAITDSTPAPRVPAVIQALESRHNDPDAGIRRRVRKTLAHYRRTGKVTDAAH